MSLGVIQPSRVLIFKYALVFFADLYFDYHIIIVEICRSQHVLLHLVNFAGHRYMEAVTPILAALHPSTVIDGLHFKSTSLVKAENQLKQKQSVSDEDVEKKKQQQKFITKKANVNSDDANDAGDEGAPKSKISHFQVILSLSKVREEHLLIKLSAFNCLHFVCICLDFQ